MHRPFSGLKKWKEKPSVNFEFLLPDGTFKAGEGVQHVGKANLNVLRACGSFHGHVQ